MVAERVLEQQQQQPTAASDSSSPPTSSRTVTGTAAATEYLAQDRFHQRFILPATANHGELQVSYADVGRRFPKDDDDDDNDDDPITNTILFIPGMFASRYLSVWMHAIAEKVGVRVLIVDRPGMGHSTDVPLDQRLDIWIELVPRLLAHLRIRHVALASHSAGTIYLFNTLIRCRDILDPKRPLVALVAPWVDPTHSQVATMQMAQSLPASVFGIWHHLPKIASAGGAAFNKVTKLLLSSSSAISGGISSAPAAAPTTESSLPVERNRQKIETDYGLSAELQRELQPLVLKSMFAENMVGADSEALICLRKGPAGLWGECDDYAGFVKKLAELERERLKRAHAAAAGQDDDAQKEKLRITAYFAETDAMIGKKGQIYFEECWKGSSSSSSSNSSSSRESGGGGGGDDFRDVLNFSAATIPETDHDSVVLSAQVLEQIFVNTGGGGGSGTSRSARASDMNNLT